MAGRDGISARHGAQFFSLTSITRHREKCELIPGRRSEPKIVYFRLIERERSDGRERAVVQRSGPLCFKTNRETAFRSYGHYGFMNPRIRWASPWGCGRGRSQTQVLGKFEMWCAAV